MERDLQTADDVSLKLYDIALVRETGFDDTLRRNTICRLLHAVVDRVFAGPLYRLDSELQWLSDSLGSPPDLNSYRFKSAACRLSLSYNYGEDFDLQRSAQSWKKHFEKIVSGHKHLAVLESNLVEHIPLFTRHLEECDWFTYLCIHCHRWFGFCPPPCSR